MSEARTQRKPYSDFVALDWVKYGLLKLAVSTIYVVSHLYDYLFYPIYCVVQHPWVIRQYRRMVHSSSEVTWTVEDKNAIVYRESKTRVSPGVEAIHTKQLDTMLKVFEHLGASNGSKPCLGTREILASKDEVQSSGRVFQKFVLGKYVWISIDDFKRRVRCLAKAMVDVVGVRPLRANWVDGLAASDIVSVEDNGVDRIAIIAETRADWLVTAFACFHIATPLVTLYTNLGVDSIVQALVETEATTLVCSTETFDKVRQVLPQCPSVVNVLVMDSLVQSERSATREKVRTALKPMVKQCLAFIDDLCGDIMTVGRDSSAPASSSSSSDDNNNNNSSSGQADAQVDSRFAPRPSDCAIIMYTSGSTGKPKGVVLSHFNLVSAIAGLSSICNFKSTDRYIGYLPLAHVLELLAETTSLIMGLQIGYSSPNTLTNKSSKVKAGCKGDANVFRPTVMCAVPLILERVYKSIVETANRQGWAVAELFDFLVKYKMKWQDRGFDTPLLNHTLFRRIRYFLGGRVRVMLCGGAPLSDATYSLTRTCLCVPLIQGYGLTETTACAAVVDVRDRSTGRVGAPLPSVDIKLVSWREGGYLTTDKPNARGEIHVGGPVVAAGGYFRQPEQTANSFYTDETTGTRWFRTGDIGEFDKDGILKIVDRCKDLVKLQGGEYISYAKIEPVLKNCAFVESICVYADPLRDYTIAILVPVKEGTKVGSSSGDSGGGQSAATDGAQSQKAGDRAASVVPRTADGDYDTGEMARRLTQHGLRNGLLRFELPTKVIAVDDEWTPDSGLVTAAFKIRRRQIVEHYRAEIDAIYTES